MYSTRSTAARRNWWVVIITSSAILAGLLYSIGASAGSPSYERARWHPIHRSPQIEQASDAECLECHREILDHRPRKVSPAGVRADRVQAWYQTLDTYAGEQADFHARHLKTAYSEKVMSLKCTTCHQGSDPREEAVSPPTSRPAGFTLRKMVDPGTCLMCHGRMPHELMGLPGPWTESREMFGNNCQTCHAVIRTVRHQVNFLKADAIEKLGADSGDVCYGCHGGRQWYRIAYPYPRHAWPGMADEVPDWAKGRPNESAPRFRSATTTSAGSKDNATR